MVQNPEYKSGRPTFNYTEVAEETEFLPAHVLTRTLKKRRRDFRYAAAANQAVVPFNPYDGMSKWSLHQERVQYVYGYRPPATLRTSGWEDHRVKQRVGELKGDAFRWMLEKGLEGERNQTCIKCVQSGLTCVFS